MISLTTFAQEFTTYGSPVTAETSTESALPVLLLLAIALPFVAVTIAGMWKTYAKAGKPGWAAIVPLYNYYVLLQIVGRPTWWLVLILLGIIPFVGAIIAIVVSVIVMHDLSKSFGKGIGMTLLQLFLPVVAYSMLGFGNAKYLGPSVGGGVGTPTTPETPSQTGFQPPQTVGPQGGAPITPTPPSGQVSPQQPPQGPNSTPPQIPTV